MKTVFVYNGRWRDQEIQNTEFQMVSDGVMEGKNGLYITVDKGEFISNSKNIRIYIDNVDDVQITGNKKAMFDDEQDYEPEVEETDAEIIDRINDRFAVLSDMTQAACNSIVRSLIVGGAPGVGKSFTVEKTLREVEACNGNINNYEVIKGTISPINLYKKLYEFRGEGNVLVFDDCDSVFFDQVSLAVLKAALDSSDRRVISWHTNSNDLRDSEIPNSFIFHGSVIFITNMDMDNTSSKALKPHFDAIISRSHYLDLTIKSERDKFLRIKGLVSGSDMLKKYGFQNGEEDKIVNFMGENVKTLRELSLRTTIKIADIAKMKPNDWERICKMTVCK